MLQELHERGVQIGHELLGIRIQGYFKIFRTNDVAIVVEKLKILSGQVSFALSQLCGKSSVKPGLFDRS